MASSESLTIVRSRIGERIAEIEAGMPRMTPPAIQAKMDAIRAMAVEHGLGALEGLADFAAHHARMPGCAVATRVALGHLNDALASDGRASDRESVLAAVALRLH